MKSEPVPITGACDTNKQPIDDRPPVAYTVLIQCPDGSTNSMYTTRNHPDFDRYFGDDEIVFHFSDGGIVSHKEIPKNVKKKLSLILTDSVKSLAPFTGNIRATFFRGSIRALNIAPKYKPEIIEKWSRPLKHEIHKYEGGISIHSEALIIR